MESRKTIMKAQERPSRCSREDPIPSWHLGKVIRQKNGKINKRSVNPTSFTWKVTQERQAFLKTKRNCHDLAKTCGKSGVEDASAQGAYAAGAKASEFSRAIKGHDQNEKKR